MTLERFRQTRLLGATFTEPCIPALMSTQVGIRNVGMGRKMMAVYELSLRTPPVEAIRRAAVNQNDLAGVK